MADQGGMNQKPPQPSNPNLGPLNPSTPEVQTTNQPSKPSPASQNKKILLIDDDPSFVRLYTTAFKQKGINFSVAMSGAKALEKVKFEKPDLMLLDVMMPGMSGFEVLVRMRQDSQTKNIPIWMLTNLGEEYGKEKSVGTGAQEYIVKTSTSPLIVCGKISKFFETNSANQ